VRFTGATRVAKSIGRQVLDYDSVVGALLAEEMRRKSSKETSTSEMMLVRGRTKEQNERSFSRSKSRHRKGKAK
jgi:hypothetical protein